MLPLGENFQDCSWIQDFEAHFSQKVSLKILNMADSDLFSVYLKMIDCLNLKLSIFIGILQVLRCDIQKFRILEILNFHPWLSDNRSWKPILVFFLSGRLRQV